MQIPTRDELERLFGAEKAKEVHFLETVGSWPSLRVLDYLYSKEPATTGDIARALNMDMRDVKDHLNELESHNIVKKVDDGWKAKTDLINITLTQNNGLKITHTIEGDEQQIEEHTDQQQDQKTNENILTSFRQLISSLFDSM